MNYTKSCNQSITLSAKSWSPLCLTKKDTMKTEEPKSDGTFKITGNWDVQSKSLKKKFNQLTDADLKFEHGKESELLGRIENRLNKKRDEVIKIIRGEQTIIS